MGSRQKWQHFRIIDELRTRHPLSILLFYSGLSRSGYYKWKKSAPKQDSNEDIVEYIKAIHSLRPFYGYRRITTTLHREGLIVNHKRVHRLMQQLGIQSAGQTHVASNYLKLFTTNNQYSLLYINNFK
ncbi:IS3 family transposase [Desulfovibrio sp.]|uniref:IS3 family transposase n=1 Tax=Desulfovibrio sp. TaxID=885 RepID=UPI00345B66E3